jgi:AmmeMemoRadiSam system protein A
MKVTDAAEAGPWLAVARAAVTHAAYGRRERLVPTVPDPSRPHSGVFVTLRKFQRLRGCMGLLDSRPPIADAIVDAATLAAVKDPRFPPLTIAELGDIRLELSILSRPQPLRSIDDLELGRHGIIVSRDQQRGLFLPSVATTHNMDRETFLSRCCADKAGLPPDAWRDPGTHVESFETTTYADPDT